MPNAWAVANPLTQRLVGRTERDYPMRDASEVASLVVDAPGVDRVQAAIVIP